MIEKRSAQIWGMTGLAIFLITLLGWWQSPIEQITGRPLLLIPEVKAIVDYQAKVRGWMDAFQSLDAALSGLLLDTNGDLFSQSQQGNRVLQQAVELAQTIDQTEAPATLVSWHSQLKTISLAYLDAARLALRFIGASNPENHSAAQAALEQARKQLESAKTSEWMAP